MEKVFDLIINNKENMSKSHKKLSEYILQNKTKVSFLNITALAHESGISEATIVRFCSVLGYKGYPQLRQEIQNALQEKITLQERLTISKDMYSGKEEFVNQIISGDAVYVQNLLNNFDSETFFSIIDCFINSKKICIVAGRSTIALAQFMFYYFNLIFDDVCLISNADDASQKYTYFEEGSVVFGITFSRYSKSTIKIMEYAKKQNCITIGLTDTYISPIIPFCEYSLFAQTNVPSLFDTYVAPLSLINAMIAYLCNVENEKIGSNIQKADKLWGAFDIFENK